MKQNNDGIFVPETTLTMVVLRGCRNCGDKHPLAYDPPRPDGACPKCGAPSVSPEPPITDAMVTTGNRASFRETLKQSGASFLKLVKG